MANGIMAFKEPSPIGKEETELDDKGQGRLELIAVKTVNSYDELYIIVDFLNKTLKEHGFMFGLTKDSVNQTMTVSIYRI